MNYANMIEEKNLKKTFIVATLCSTLIGTFTASMGLYDRVAEKRQQKIQAKKDTKQDEEIKRLKEEVQQAEKRGKDRTIQERLQGDDVGHILGMSGAMIQRQYDEGYGRMGRRFAMGDTLTENALQAQIIALQQTVIHVLQDALYNERPLTRADQAKLIAASNAAREGSLRALRQQQLRLDGNMEHSPPRSVANSVQRSIAAPKRAATIRDSSPQLSIAAPRRASTIIEAAPLFCRYSLDLQYIPNKPLAASFAPGEDCHCPACGLHLAVTSDDFWQIGKRTPILITEGGYEKEVMETREFHLGQRFVIKCHTADGEYACVLCSKHRDVDAICRSVEALVNHVGNYHEVDELERDVDLREHPPMRIALPAPPPPPVPSPPVVVETVKQYQYS